METTTPGSIDVSTSSGLDPGVPVARDTDNTKWSMAFPSYQNRNHAAASEGIAGHGDTQILTAEEQEAAVELESAATNWIVATWKLKDSHIISRAGADAMQYLSFQRHMIVFMALVTAISLLIILPVNILLGDQEGSPFAITTISNIEKTSAILWLHIIIGISMLPLGILVMRQYTKTLTRTIHEERGAKTLMISHIPRSQCSLQLISQHFHEAYPRMEVTDIQLAYDVQKLTNLNIQKESVTQARLTAEYHFRTTGERMKMAPYHGGYFFGCCCKQVDALEFYLNEELRYSARVEAERLVSLEKPLGIAFVTFKTSQDAQDVKMDLDTWSTYFRKKEPAKSSVSDQLMVSRWNAILAPAPKDIYW
ncbi:unnamed protein product [Cyprideis torosa]|uniref:Uncharacterized protein n=1 Tax=Cyprideis torosa TaxID=163714 RepID=A0A7R8WBZ8_9CRUS|nr:unnamed protein product [Cyprideis torosa]CAG0887910.1 unnamed protein product [Cyprideis torosa]